MVDRQGLCEKSPAVVFRKPLARADPRGRCGPGRGLPQGVRRADAERECGEGAGLIVTSQADAFNAFSIRDELHLSEASSSLNSARAGRGRSGPAQPRKTKWDQFVRV